MKLTDPFARVQACIDQADTTTSLECLPIFLAGCRKLLVLAGPSFPTRLWCAMEIFIFVHMGGKHENMVVKLLDGDDSQVIDNLKKFDARKAKCDRTLDQHTLWMIIESAYGDLLPFNRVVRDIFAASAASRPLA